MKGSRRLESRSCIFHEIKKLENDRATKEVLEPAAARKADAVKEKQNLAGD